jgi:hypothetical protein
LKLAIVEDEDDEDDADDDTEHQIENGEVLTEEVDNIEIEDHDTELNSSESLKIVETYQAIKDYLTTTNQSLSEQ